MRLVLSRCPDAVCDWTAEPAVLDVQPAKDHHRSLPRVTAVAASGPRVAVAYYRYSGFGSEGDRPTVALRLAVCRDVRCAGPRLVTLAEFDSASGMFWGRAPLAVAFAGGRPVVAFADPSTGDVSLASCGTPACDRPTVAVIPDVPAVGDAVPGLAPAGLDVAVPEHGRPVVAYTPSTAEARGRLFTCTTRASCGAFGRVLPPDPGFAGPGPALALDTDGRLLVATFDQAARQVLLLSCRDPACQDNARIPLARAGTPGAWRPGPVDLAVGADGRPRVVWIDRAVSTSADGSVHTTSHADPLTCRQIGCRAEG